MISQDTHWNPSNMIYGDNPVQMNGRYVPDIYAIIQSSNLYAYCGNNPVRFIDPSGCVEVEDITRTLARWLIGNPINNWVTKNGWFKDLFRAAGFVRTKDLNGTYIYHATPDCFQQIGGYNDFYDTVFYYATSMDKAKFQFSSGSQEYMFWAWKGDYLNLGAGAELGIYSNKSGIIGAVDVTSPLDSHWFVDTSLAMHMTLTLQYKGKTIISWDPKKDKKYAWDKVWWVTGFNPYYTEVDAKDLTAIYTVTFNTQTMYNDFKKSLDPDEKRWVFDDKKYIATFTF
jgi:hypothetical protein